MADPVIYGPPVIFKNSVDMKNASSVTYKDGGIDNSAIAAGAAIERTKLKQENATAYPLPLTGLRVWDARQTLLPGAAAADDLGLITGTLGTDAPTLQTSDAKATTITQYAGFTFTLPPEYVAAQTVTLRLRAGMITTVSDGTATVDVEAYRHDDDGAVAADICATAAQSINSLTKANKDFDITATTLNPGDQIDFRVAVAITDSATSTAVIGEISKIVPLLDIQG